LPRFAVQDQAALGFACFAGPASPWLSSLDAGLLAQPIALPALQD